MREMHTFVENHTRFIYTAAARVARRHGLDAHDVAHDAIAALLHLHAIGSFDPGQIRERERYLRTVVRNTAHKTARRAHRHVPASDRLEPLIDEDAPSPAVEDSIDARSWLVVLKQRLRPREADAFALLIDEDQPIAEIAAALSTNPNNVYQMRHRVRTAARTLERELRAS